MRKKESIRRYRVPASGRVTIKHDGQTVPATLKDVSLGGVFFFADAQFHAGAAIEVVLMLPRDVGLPNDQMVLCHGKIVRVESHEGRLGFAAEFERMAAMPQV